MVTCEDPMALREDSLVEKLAFFDKAWAITNAASFREKESVLLWLLNTLRDTKTKNDKLLLLQSLHNGLNQSSISTSNPLSYSATSALVKFIAENSQKRKGSTELKVCIEKILTITSVKNYLKQNENECADIFASLCLRNPPELTIIATFVSLYHSIASNDKAVTALLKKAFNSLAVLTVNLNDPAEEKKVARHSIVSLLKSILFGKNHASKLKLLLEACFEKTEEGKSVRHTAVFKALGRCFKSDLRSCAKVGLCRLVVEALISSDHVEDLEVLRFAVLIGHLLGIEQNVGSEPLLDAELITTVLGVSASKSPCSTPIWNGVLEVLGKRSLNLSLELPKLSGLQWFRSSVASILIKEDINEDDIDTLAALFKLDSAVLEPSLSKIFMKIFKNALYITSEEYQDAYIRFLMTTMTIFSRLQRINKLIQKLLPAIKLVPAAVPSQKILPHSFLDSLSGMMTILPSTHGLSLIQILLEHLESCIDAFGEEKLNPTWLQSVGVLLCTVLSGCRLLCYSLPRTVISAFIGHVERIKDLLARFGTLILSRPHDRGIMQSYLRVCHVWGEVSTLAALYASGESPPHLAPDSAPSDLSPTLPFLHGDQWSVFVERIANFGDQLCNQLLMKLLVQKLRVASLSGEKSSVNLEATAKYLVERLKGNVHGVEIVSVFEPEELSILLVALPYEKAKTSALTLIHLFEHLIDTDDSAGPKTRWAQDQTLLENSIFVETMFEVVIKELLESCDEADIRPDLKELYQHLRAVSSSCLSELSSDSTLRSLLDDGFVAEPPSAPLQRSDRLEKACSTLVNLPLRHIGSLGNAGLVAVAAVMVSLDIGDRLLPVFARLLSLLKTADTGFDCGLCIHWLAANISDPYRRAPVVELLVILSTSSTSGLKKFKSLVKSLKREHSLLPMKCIETQVHLHNAIRKCWRPKGDPEAVELNDAIAKQRRRLTKGLQAALQDAPADSTAGASDWVLLDAFAIELMRMARTGNVEGIIALNFKSFLQKALQGAKAGLTTDDPAARSSLNFLTAVLKCAVALRQATANEDFVFTIWRQLKGQYCPDLWQHICPAASEKEFKKIMDDLLTSVEAGLCPPEHEVVNWEDNLMPPDQLRPLVIQLAENSANGRWSNHSIDLWKLFMQKSSGEKQKCCWDMIRRLISRTQNILPRADDSYSDSLLSWTRFLHFVATHPSIPMRPDVEDYLLDVVLAAPEANIPFFEHFVARMDVLSALIAPQKVPVLRKVPLIFTAYQKLLRWLLRESDTATNLSQDEVSSRALAAFHMEKWTGLFVRRKEEFRVIPLFISDIIQSLANVTLYPPVKMHLNNLVFNMLRVTDEQTLKFLLRTLPPGCQQVFTNLHSEFQKFHRYKGKI